MEDPLKNNLIELLKKGGSELGFDIGERETGSFLLYLSELKKWNSRINLTAIDTDREIITLHFLDSLILGRFITGSESLLDMGAGAGFPGIPLKIMHPSLELILMDSVLKKVNFMNHAIRVLGLKSHGKAEAVHARVEDKAFIQKYGKTFDIATSRAFTRLDDFVAKAAPYLKEGGRILAMKGPSVKDELGGFKGFSMPECIDLPVPFTDRKTTVVVLNKIFS